MTHITLDPADRELVRLTAEALLAKEGKLVYTEEEYLETVAFIADDRADPAADPPADDDRATVDRLARKRLAAQGKRRVAPEEYLDACIQVDASTASSSDRTRLRWTVPPSAAVQRQSALMLRPPLSVTERLR